MKFVDRPTFEAPVELTTGGPLIHAGSGSPEGVLAAIPGSTWTNKDTGDLWVKRFGTGVNGWVLGGAQLLDDTVPIGAVIAFGGTTAPGGWHLCDGSAHNSPALQAVIGTSTTPDLRGRFLLAAGQGQGNDAAGNPMVNRVQGATGGEQKHPLLVEEIPSHRHEQAWNTAYDTGSEGFKNWGASITGDSAYKVYQISPSPSTGYTGGGQSHENMPPFYVLTYIIKKVGLVTANNVLVSGDGADSQVLSAMGAI